MSEQPDGLFPAVSDYRCSATVGELAKALAKAQGVIEGAKKDTDGQVGTAKKKYADLASVWAACKKALADNGVAVIQVPVATAAAAGVSTLMAHGSGEWVSGTLLLPVARRDAQGMGSAITYARRYALMAFVGVAPEDDDGDASTGRQEGRQAAQQPRQKQGTPPAAPPGAPSREDIQAAHLKVKQVTEARKLSGVWGLALTACGLHPGDGWHPPRNRAEAVQSLGHLTAADVARVEKWLDGQLALPTPEQPAPAAPQAAQQQPQPQARQAPPQQAPPPAAESPPPRQQPAPAPAVNGTHVNDEAEARRLVGEIDAGLRRAGKLWLAGLKHVGVNRLPSGWPEPADEVAARTAVLALLAGGVVTIYQLRRLAKEMEPKGKKAPGQQPAA